MIVLFWLHFIADFILQTDKMALNKSKSFKWLSIHALVYGIPFLLYISIAFGWLPGIVYALINSVMHWIVDAITSRITSYLWQKEKRHWFFVVIGLDQAIHMTCLVLTFEYLWAILVLLSLLGVK
jgi:hypothetical protein